jgi:hypothetical protein
MPWISDITARLAAQGVGTVGTDIFAGRMPDSPDTCVAVSEYGGSAPDYVHNGTTPQFESLRFQVKSRAKGYATAEAKAQAVFTALKPLIATTVLSGTTYKQITPIQSPFPAEYDGQNRTIFVQNFEVKK